MGLGFTVWRQPRSKDSVKGCIRVIIIKGQPQKDPVEGIKVVYWGVVSYVYSLYMFMRARLGYYILHSMWRRDDDLTG